MMTNKISLLLESKKAKHSSKILASSNFEEVVGFLSKQIVECNNASIILLTNIFHGLSGDAKQQEKKGKIALQVFKILNNKEVSIKISNDLVGFLVLEVDAFQIKELTQIANAILKRIKDGMITNSNESKNQHIMKVIALSEHLISTYHRYISEQAVEQMSLELFPKILSILSLCSSINVDEEGAMSGAEYKRMIVNKISNTKWAPNMAIFVCTMIRDIELDGEEMLLLVKKILRVLHDIPLHEIPPLLYQLLLLSNKGSKKEILDGIVTFFYEKTRNLPEEDVNPLLREDTEEAAQLKSAEGTVLLHVVFTVKQNQELGRIFIKYIKVESQIFSSKVLSTFTVALILALTQIHRLEEPLLDFLKSYITKIFKDDVKRSQSKWIKDLFPDTVLVEESVMSAVRNSNCGWDYVSEGLIKFGFILINSYSPKQSEYFTISSGANGPLQRACKLGLSILQCVFKEQEILREVILQQLLDAIVLKATQNVNHYLDLLSSCVASVPQIVIDCLPKFREVFDYLSLLNLPTTEGLLRAVLPLMKFSMTIKDSLILVLKNSMFSKQVEARKIAVTGFLLILKHFKVNTDGAPFSLSSQVAFSQSFSCSQLDIATQCRYNVAANEAFCLEIIGNLKKSLTQHGDVRENLYNGIYEVVQKNPRLSHAVLDLLYQQFLKFYVAEDDVLPPLKLELCTSNHLGEMQIAEPFADLLYAMQLCTKKSGKRLDADDEEDDQQKCIDHLTWKILSHLLDDVEDSLAFLTKRMIKADLEDFALDKTVDYSSASEEGLKNQLLAQVLMGVYEVLIEYNFMKATEISTDMCEIIQQLTEKHEKVVEVLKDKANGGGKKGKSSSANKQIKNYFSFKCLSNMLAAILCNEEAAAEPGLNILRQSVGLSKFLGNCVLTKLNQVIENKKCDGAGGKHLDHIFRHSLTLAKSFLRHINGDCLLRDDVLKRDKGRKLGNICLDGLNAIVSFVCKHMQKEQLTALLRSLDFSPDVITQNDAVTDGSLVFRIIRRIQRMAVKIISSPDEDLGHKEALVLVQMLLHLAPHLEMQTEIMQVYTWFYRVATEHHIDELTLAKALLTKLLKLHHQHKGGSTMVTKISQDIHSQIGDIDEDVEVENRSHFLLVTEKTAAPTVFLAVLQFMEAAIDEVDWALAALKNIPNTLSGDEENEEDTPSVKKEKIVVSMSQTLIGIVLSLHELTQSAFPLGMVSDNLTKVVTKLYTTLGNFAKYHLNMYAQKCGQVTPKFERLVKLTGSHLVQQVYAMLPYMQSAQTHQLQEQTLNGRTKSKDKKKANTLGKSRALKESRSIPNLIYSIEQFERYLILLSKKSKIDFMEHMKRSTSRDFRINTASLEAALQNVAEEDNTMDVTTADMTEASQTSQLSTSTAESTDTPSSKRVKLSTNLSRRPLSSVVNKS